MTQKLKLHSPVGSDPLILKWPVPTSEGKDGPEEILDTIRLVCDDYPELKTPLETRILKDGEDVSNYDFEQTKAMCERYNKAIDSLRQLVKGHPRQKSVSKQASMRQLKHILQQCYNHSVKDPEKLNHYEPFSPEVYGETSFELVEQMIKYVKFSESDYFIDLGSGVGQVVLQVSAATNCKFCYGVEKAEWPAEYAQVLEKEFKKWMKWFGKEHGDYKIEKGDFLHDDIKEKLNKATIVFVNNFAFGPVVDHELKQRFANCLKEGARIVSSKAFCPLNFRITARNLSDIGTIMQVEELSPLCGAVSWTGKPFAYYVHTIDRTLLEKYFQRLRFPSQKNEDEPRKDRKGRPLLSIKDKINGALSGGSDSNSSGRWRRAKGIQREIETASPLSAAKVLDFDSGSNSSFTNSTTASVPAVDETSIVYGPTTRRQWNEYVKRPQSQSGTENDNDSSAADANSVDLKTKDEAIEVTQKKKRMKSVKRLNNGALGMRKMQVGRKNSEPVKSKAAVKLRPRKKQAVRSSSSLSKRAASAAAAAAAASIASGVSTTTSTVSSNPSAHTNGTVTPSLDSLNLLHAHTIMSTSGKDPAEKVNYNDRRMTETSSAYFKPTVQKQTVSMLEKEAGFLQMIETMKQRFLSFLTFMQTPEYRAMLLLQIEQEKRKNSTLRSQTDSLEKDISVLQKEGVRLIKERLKEMGIKADTPRELISQAKDIMLRHHELKSQTASLGAQINALQTEHTQKVIAYRKVLDRKLGLRHAENGFNDHISQLDKEHLDQKILLINRLHTELQHLQNVNKTYVRPETGSTTGNVRPEVGNTTGNGLDLGLNLLNEGRGVLKGKGGLDQPCLNSYTIKEKLDMKENYDAFGTVFAMVKKELTSTLQSSTAAQSGVPAGKSEPGQVSETQNDNVKQDMIDKAQQLNVDIKSNNTSFCGNDVNSSNAHCNNIQSFKAPEILAKDVSEVTTSVSQTSSSASSSWTSELRRDGIVTSASPRILPPGMKIDIKKPSRLNGLNTALKTRVSNPNSYMLQNPESLLNHSYKVNPNGGFSTLPTLNLYTENEKSAAEDLISLKESLNTSGTSLELQVPVLNKTPVSLSTSSSISSSLPGMEYVQSHANDSNPSSRRHSPYDKPLAILVTDKAHTGSSNSLSKDSSVPCAISPSSTPHVFAQVPVANFNQIGSSSSQMASQNNQISTATSGIAQSNVKIITNPPKNGLVKHKNYDTSIVHRPIKMRTLETGSDVKLGVTSILPSFRAQPQHQSQIVQIAPAGTNLAHPVKSEPGNHTSSQSFLNAHTGIVVSTATTRSIGSGSLPFVTIQSPHAVAVSQGSNGLEASVLKILQQKPVVISPNNNSVFNGTVCSNSASLALSSAMTSHLSSAQSDAIGQAVKMLPQNGRDSKGGLHSPEASSLVSEYDACEPVSSPEYEHTCCSRHTFQECAQQALSIDCILDSASDSSEGMIHKKEYLSSDICSLRKRRKCGRSEKFNRGHSEIPLKVSKLSSDFDLGCLGDTSHASILRAVSFSDTEAMPVKEKQGHSTCETNGSSVTVMLKREAKLEKMVENISNCDERGRKKREAETHMYSESDKVLQNGKKGLKHLGCEDAEERKLLERTEKEEIIYKNQDFDANVTSSQLMLSSAKYPIISKFSESYSEPNKNDLQLEPEVKNSALIVDKTARSRPFDSSAGARVSRKDELISGYYRHQRGCSLHRNKHDPLSEIACVKSLNTGCRAALLPKQTTRTTENSRKTLSDPHANSSYINDQSKTSEKQEYKLIRSDKKSHSAKSDTSKMSHKDDHSSYYNIDTRIDCFSESMNVKHEKLSLSRHSKSSVSKKCRRRSGSKPAAPFTKVNSATLSESCYSSVKLESKTHRHHHLSGNHRSSCSSKSHLSLEHSREISYKGKMKSIDQECHKKKESSSGIIMSSCERKRISAKSSRNHSSYKQKDMSPGPPTLERAVSPPPSHQRRYTASKMSQNTCQGDTFIAHSDTANMDLWCELCDDFQTNCNCHHRASQTPASTSCCRKSTRSECHSRITEPKLQRSHNTRSVNIGRNSSSPTHGRRFKADCKVSSSPTHGRHFKSDCKVSSSPTHGRHFKADCKDSSSPTHGRHFKADCKDSSSPTHGRHFKTDCKDSFRGEIMKEKDRKLLGARSQRLHRSCSESAQSQLKEKLKSKYASCSKAAGGSVSGCTLKSHKSTFKYNQNSKGSNNVKGSRRTMENLSDRTLESNTSKLTLEGHEEHSACGTSARDTMQTDISAKASPERLPHTEAHKPEPESECTLATCLDSPYSMLTPKSVSQGCQMDEDKNADCPGAEVLEQDECKYSLTHTTVIDPGIPGDIHPKDKPESDGVNVVNISVPDAESFPFPPTPGKTPRSASVPCSPCAEVNNQTSEETNEIIPEEVKSVPGNNPIRKGPQTPPGSPLFNHQSQSRSRSLSVSSSSSRGSSCDSCQSTSSSSSFTDSSSDRKRRRKRRYQHLKTPPRKLSTLIPQALGIGSPPKATVLYSPMPSPNMNGLKYGAPVRLGMGSSGTNANFGNHNAVLGSSLLSPLSISTQQNSGYQMVTSDSLRSPSGSLRSPVSGGLIRQHPVFPNTLLSPVSTGQSIPSSSQSHLVLKDNNCTKSVSSKELQGDSKNMVGTPEYKYDKAEILLPTGANILQISNRLPPRDTHTTDLRAKLMAVEDSESSTLDAVGVVKDHNGNNTTVRCSHSSHLQQAHVTIDYNKNVCQVSASFCSASPAGGKLPAVIDAKCTSPSSNSASFSCAGQLKSQLGSASGMNSLSVVASSYSDQGSCSAVVIDKTAQQSSCLLPCQSSSASSFTSTISTENNNIIVDAFKTLGSEQLPVHGHKSNMPYSPCSLKKGLQYNPLPSANKEPNNIGQSQPVSLLPHLKRQPRLSQSLDQPHKLPSFHQTSSPPPLPPHQGLQHPQRQVRQKSTPHAPHSSHFNPHLNHSYKSNNMGNRRAGFGFRLPLSHNAPPNWSHMSSQVYPSPYCPNGSLLSRPRHVQPSGPIPGFREAVDSSLLEHFHNGMMDYPLHGTLTQPYGSGQWDHSTPLYCMGSGPAGLGRSVQQHYNRSYHHKHH
ncbi:hypothetical protein BsWGS_19831 [Bradybaena similaris]